MCSSAETGRERKECRGDRRSRKIDRTIGHWAMGIVDWGAPLWRANKGFESDGQTWLVFLELQCVILMQH